MAGTSLRILLSSLAVASAAVSAAPSTAGDQSPFIGQWDLDLSRMPDNYGPPPKQVVYSFEDLGSGEWRTTINITAPDGSVRHVAVQYRRDGKVVKGTGDQIDGDSAAFNSPAANVLVLSLAKDKKLGSVRVYAISVDGREMTESAANVDGSGTPFVRNFHFKRIRH